MKLLLAALLGALAIFLWEFVAHMFTPLGEAGMNYLPKPATVSSSLESAIGRKAGMYIFPTGGATAESSGQEKQKAMKGTNEEMKTNASGLIIYTPPGTEFHFRNHVAVEFITDLAKTAVVL